MNDARGAVLGALIAKLFGGGPHIKYGAGSSQLRLNATAQRVAAATNASAAFAGALHLAYSDSGSFPFSR